MALTRKSLQGSRATTILAWAGIVTTIGMFVVIAQGDLVTNAGAAQGCGRSWPLCHGRLVPIFDPQTLIEFSHRLVVGIVSIGVLVLAIGILWRSPAKPEAWILAPSLVVFLVLQAVLGGLAVLWPQTPAILALHMGISLISFATVLLTTMLLLGERTWDTLRDRPPPTRFVRLVWFAMLYLYVLIYLGAFVRHSNAMLACTGWPLCNGRLVPDLGGLVWINFGHRIGAALGIVVFGFVWSEARAIRHVRPDLAWASAAAFFFVLAQAATGGAVSLSGFALWSALAHGTLMTPVFGATSFLCLQVSPRGRVRSKQPSAERSATSPAIAVVSELSN